MTTSPAQPDRSERSDRSGSVFRTGPTTDQHHPAAPDRSGPESTRAARAALVKRTMRGSGHLTNAFYLVVLVVALTGSGDAAANHWLHVTLPVALVVVGTVELGGVVLAKHAEARRMLGESAILTRLLSAAVAVGAVAVNWFGHLDPSGHPTGLAWFFAGLSALGYLVYLTKAESKRRDQLRAEGRLPESPPQYPLVQWIFHPVQTIKARDLGKRHPELGTYGTLDMIRTAKQRAARDERIRRAVLKMIRDNAGSDLAEIASATHDPAAVAKMLAALADEDALARALYAQMYPEKLAGVGPGPDRTAERTARTGPGRAGTGKRTGPADRKRPVRTGPASDRTTGPDQPDRTAPAAGPARGTATGPDRLADSPTAEHPTVAARTGPADRTGVADLGQAKNTIIGTLVLIAGHYALEFKTWSDLLAARSATRIAADLRIGKGRVMRAIEHTDLITFADAVRRAAGPDRSDRTGSGPDRQRTGPAADRTGETGPDRTGPDQRAVNE